MNQTDKWTNFFTDLKNTSPYFKAAAEGKAGTGKTFTLALIAAGLHKRIGSKKPIVIFDTERSAKFLRPFFAQYGIEVLLKDSRTLSDLTATMDYCEDGNSDLLIIDSITHVYEQYLEAYKQRKGRKFLQFQDWGELKPTWKREFSERLVNGRYHILFSGREGYIYDYEVNEDTGKRELVKTGVKMKAEGETAYEPDVLFRMERYEELLEDEKKVWRECTIIKDRANLIDGKTFVDPTYENFEPVLDFLLSDVSDPVETSSRSDEDLFETDEDNSEERRNQKIWLERIEALLDKVAAGTTRDAKTMRLALKEFAFVGEASDTAISRMSAAQLEDAHQRLEPTVITVGHIIRGEKKVYPKGADEARIKFGETINLGEFTAEQMDAYLADLIRVAKESTEKKGAA